MIANFRHERLCTPFRGLIGKNSARLQAPHDASDPRATKGGIGWDDDKPCKEMVNGWPPGVAVFNSHGSEPLVVLPQPGRYGCGGLLKQQVAQPALESQQLTCR